MNRSMLTTLVLVAPLVPAVAGLEACDHDTAVMAPSGAQVAPAPTPTATAPRSQMGSTNRQPTAANSATAEPAYGPQSPMIPGGWGLPPDLTGLDDGQLAGIVQAIHQADIDHLQLALTRASSADLLSFARDGIEVQRAGASQDDTDLAQLKITPSVSPMSKQVLMDWQRDRSGLQISQASDFDRAFIDHHVTRDARAVALLDAAIDNVKSPALRAHLQSDRTSLAGHLREAEHVQMTMR